MDFTLDDFLKYTGQRSRREEPPEPVVVKRSAAAAEATAPADAGAASATKRVYTGPAIISNASKKPVIAYDIYAAINVLVDADRNNEIKLGRAITDVLRQIQSQSQHEFFTIDPPVLIYDTLLPNQVYIEEVVPISLMLLATYLHCISDEVKMVPYEGRSVKGAKSFQLRAKIVEELKGRGFDPDDIFFQLDMFMKRIGELSSADAATNGIWFEDNLKQLPQILK